MNACLQCFYRVPELKEAFASPAGASSSQPLTREASKMFAQMAKGVTVIPGSFWGALRMAVPQFDQMGNAKSAGGYRVHAQQDAEECWTAVRVPNHLYLCGAILGSNCTGSCVPLDLDSH